VDRTSPYANYNFTVDLKTPGVDIDHPFGGFSEVSGIGTELTVSEYRYGNDKEMHVRKIPGVHKSGDVTLKRGILNSKDFWEWIASARRASVNAQRDVQVTLRDESGKDVESWTLRNCIPLKYTGPTLQGKGGGDVAMEELVLSSEGIVFNPPGGGSEIG
jgi:phage tail-like protein